MNGARNQFLASTARAGNQNGCRARRHHLNETENLLHLLRWSDQRSQRSSIPQLSPRRLQFHPRTQQCGGILQDGSQAAGIDWFGYVVVSPDSHRLNRAINGSLCGHHDYGNGFALAGNSF